MWILNEILPFLVAAAALAGVGYYTWHAPPYVGLGYGLVLGVLFAALGGEGHGWLMSVVVPWTALAAALAATCALVSAATARHPGNTADTPDRAGKTPARR